MGVFSGSITYKKYQVVGELPEGFRDTYLEAIGRRVHREIDPSSEDELSAGWVAVGDLLDTEPSFDRVFFTDRLCLTLRLDTLRIPAATRKIYLTKAEVEYKEATNKERLSKADREEVKDMVTKQLRKRALPTIKGFDMVWDLNEKVVRFWSQSRGVCEIFEEVFHETFEMRIIPRTPFIAIGEIGLDDEMETKVLGLDPADFVGITE